MLNFTTHVPNNLQKMDKEKLDVAICRSMHKINKQAVIH
jgi:hypothetical protein